MPHDKTAKKKKQKKRKKCEMRQSCKRIHRIKIFFVSQNYQKKKKKNIFAGVWNVTRLFSVVKL